MHVTEEIWTALPDRANRLMRAPWPEPDGRFGETQPRFEEIRNAAEIFRRSGAIVELDEEQRRIFEAVVKPDRIRDGDLTVEIERLRTRSRGPKACSATSASWRGLPRTSLRRSARSSLATAVSSKLSAASADLATDWVASLSPWPEEFGLDRMREFLDRLGYPERRATPRFMLSWTTGKSTAMTDGIAALLHAEGRRAGAIRRRTSGWAERIWVNGAEADFERAVARVRPDASAIGATCSSRR